jgi:hypothetical protein
MNILDNRPSLPFYVLAFGILLLFTACSKTPKAEPEVGPQSQYLLRDLRYHISEASRLESITLNLQDTAVSNPSGVPVTKQVINDLSALVKTSNFKITNLAELPKDINFEQFQINLPSNLYPDSSLSFTPFTVPFTTKEAEYPYQAKTSDTIVVKVPAQSKIQINTSIQAQNMNCSFTALIEEQVTGQTFPIKGTWKGLLRYDKLDIKLTERPL